MASSSKKHASKQDTGCINDSNHQHFCEACTSNQPLPPQARRVRTVELSCLKRKPDWYILSFMSKCNDLCFATILFVLRLQNLRLLKE